MNKNSLRCVKCKHWLIPIHGKMLCPCCNNTEISQLGREAEKKFMEKMEREGDVK